MTTTTADRPRQWSYFIAAMASNSNPSSEISIEEIGAEEMLDAPAEKPADDAEEIITDDSMTAAPRAVATTVVAAETQNLRGAVDEHDDEDEDDDFEDETLLERLVGLAEMFPDSVRAVAWGTACGTVSSAKWLYSASRSLSWVAFSSAVVLFFPVMIETERLGIEEAQKQQQRQILLGPGAAVSSGAAQQNAPLPTM